MTTSVKTCFKCGEEKPLTAFYVHNRMADGHLNKCKDCTLKDVKEHRVKNLARIQAYDRERGSRQTNERARELYAQDPERHLAYKKKYIRNNPHKRSAVNKVNNAVRDGRLTKQPCEVCGSTERIHGHHDDYSKPLDVQWLCRKHHSEVHKRINEKSRQAA